MNDYISTFKKDLLDIVDSLIEKSIINKSINKNDISIDFLSKSKQGDISTNLYIIIKKFVIIEKLNLKNELRNLLFNINYIKDIQIVKAGFINVFFKEDFLINKLSSVLIEKHIYGHNNIGNDKNVNIEFVSANPTGPIHIAHIRGAVYGDVLANILTATGYNVTKEYYVNDAGSQIKILGASLYKRYLQSVGIKTNLLEGEYPGQYLIKLAKKISTNDGNKWLEIDEITRNKYFQKYAVKEMLSLIKKDLGDINIYFDKFIFESEIVNENLIDEVFKILKEKNLLYEGVLDKPRGEDLDDWIPRKQLLFKSSALFDDFDRPFKKQNGEWTYFANDSAYHYHKIKRRYSELINVWGADHIGYINRMKSIVNILSDKSNLLEIKICQIVKLIKNGQILKMSKRDGNFVTLKEILNEVGKDALRYFMISTKNETPMDFDLNKVIEKNKDNKVFYCQYAYARASSVINKAKNINNFKDFENIDHLVHSNTLNEYEWEIIRKIISWPFLLQQSSFSRQPHKVINYIEDLCSNFHSLWNKGKEDKSLRFIDTANPEQTITKLVWINSFRIVLKNAFNIIGIEAHEQM